MRRPQPACADPYPVLCAWGRAQKAHDAASAVAADEDEDTRTTTAATRRRYRTEISVSRELWPLEAPRMYPHASG